MIKIVKSLILISAILFSTLAMSSERSSRGDYMPSLLTRTPLEGRMLAITIVRKTIGTIQRDTKIKRRVRNEYSDNPELLIKAAELVAYEFRTIAAANNYWRQ